MANIRVYELAKELALSNKEILELCEEVGIAGKSSHSSSLTEGEADKVRRSVIRSALEEKQPASREIKRDGKVVTEKRVGGVIRRRKKSTTAAEDEAQAEEEALAAAEEARAESRDSDEEVSFEGGGRRAAIAQADALFKTREPAGAPKEEAADEGEEPEETVSVTSTDAPEGESVEEEALEVSATEDITEESTDAPKETKSGLRGAKVLGRIELPAEPKPVAKAQPDSENNEESKLSAFKSRAKQRRAPRQFQEDEDDLSAKRRRRKQVLKKDELKDYDGDRDVWKSKKDKKSRKGSDSAADAAGQPVKRVVRIDNDIAVGEMAKQMGVKVGDVMQYLMSMGMMVTINQRIDMDTASIIAEEFNAELISTGEDIEESIRSVVATGEEAAQKIRPPVVTVMGHVDHGKTSLLDAIRETAVTDAEVGGITQHIGAYNVKVGTQGSVTFLDTPGHEAFTSLRSRGAKITDIVVLVVAADDGVMPQTIEAINHAKAAEVPIIVAMNKMDKEEANPDRIKQQVSEYGLIPEDWGGDTIFVPVSAHTKEGLDLLLENLYAQAEVLELNAEYDRPAVGTILEAKLDKGRGTVMTVLIQKGKLKVGDIFVAGSVSGKVRALVDYAGQTIEEAGPSIPVEVLGAPSAPASGNDFFVLSNETDARRFAESRAKKKRTRELASRGANIGDGGLTLERFSQMVSAGEMKDLPVVVKADVNGSVEALVGALKQLANEEVQVAVIHSGVGGVSETDVQLASASKALILAFNVRAANSKVTDLASSEGVEILYSRVIYELVEQIEKALKGMMAPIIKEKTLGRVEVRETFKVPKLGVVAGSYVVDGTVERNGLVRLLRDDRVVYEGKMASLRRFKDDVKEVAAGYECGIGIEGYSDIQDGDIIEVYKLEEIHHV